MAIIAHAQAGKGMEAASTIPARKDNEIHKSGMDKV